MFTPLILKQAFDINPRFLATFARYICSYQLVR